MGRLLVSDKGRFRAYLIIFHLYPRAKCDFQTKLLIKPTILASVAHVVEVNRFSHDLKTGKVKANRNPGGRLLVRLVAAKEPKPA